MKAKIIFNRGYLTIEYYFQACEFPAQLVDGHSNLMSENTLSTLSSKQSELLSIA